MVFFGDLSVHSAGARSKHFQRALHSGLPRFEHISHVEHIHVRETCLKRMSNKCKTRVENDFDVFFDSLNWKHVEHAN